MHNSWLFNKQSLTTTTVMIQNCSITLEDSFMPLCRSSSPRSSICPGQMLIGFFSVHLVFLFQKVLEVKSHSMPRSFSGPFSFAPHLYFCLYQQFIHFFFFLPSRIPVFIHLLEEDDFQFLVIRRKAVINTCVWFFFHHF